MKKNIFKKIISLIYLVIIVFGFFFPLKQVGAQNEANKIVIAANKYSVNSQEDIFITAKTYSFSNKLITFKSSPATSAAFTPSTCTTGSADFSTQIASCQVGFKATEGTYKITASISFNGVTTSNEISITVTKNGGTITNCPKPGNVLINGICVDPISYCPIGQILVGNSCITCTKPLVANATNDACIEPITVTPSTQTNTDTTYTLNEKLPGMSDTIETDSQCTTVNGVKTCAKCPFGDYLNTIIKIVVGFAAVLAFIMIVMGGVEYMTTELISSKEAGKDTIKNALLGLLIALGSYLILNTINPQLLNACLNTLPQAEIKITPEQQRIITNREGGGTCAVITNPSSPCYPDTIIKSGFSGTGSAAAPFNTIAAQASAICQLESTANPATLSGLDVCSDGKAFSFGLFQINASAHRSEIAACKDAFTIPAGDKTSQGNPIEYVTNSNGKKYISKWSCKTVEPAYTNCKNYLLNPVNNIKFAETLKSQSGWNPWTTYNSCKSKF